MYARIGDVLGGDRKRLFAALAQAISVLSCSSQPPPPDPCDSSPTACCHLGLEFGCYEGVCKTHPRGLDKSRASLQNRAETCLATPTCPTPVIGYPGCSCDPLPAGTAETGVTGLPEACTDADCLASFTALVIGHVLRRTVSKCEVMSAATKLVTELDGACCAAGASCRFDDTELVTSVLKSFSIGARFGVGIPVDQLPIIVRQEVANGRPVLLDTYRPELSADEFLLVVGTTATGFRVITTKGVEERAPAEVFAKQTLMVHMIAAPSRCQF